MHLKNENKIKQKTSQKSALKLQNEDDTFEIHLDYGICEVCMMNTPLNWVGCDQCTHWYHYHIQCKLMLT